MMRTLVARAAPLAALIAMPACNQQPAPIMPHEIVDRFEVGSSTYIRSLAVEAASNSLWVGSSVGVMQIDLASQEMRASYTRKDPLANEYIFAIGIDSDGYKWFGTNAGGTSRMKDGDWKVYFPMHGLADYWVYAFAEQTPRRYWIGTWAGANMVDLDSMRFETYKDELINEWVYGIAVDSKNRVWFGTEGGVSMLDDETWSHWTHEDGIGAANDQQLPISQNTGLGTRTRHDLSIVVGGQESYNPNYVFSMLADAGDVIWAGTWGGGVSRYQDGRWSNLTVDDGLAGNVVYAIAQSPDGNYWFGTNNGLSRFDGREWRNYGVETGLPDSHVYAIATTSTSDVWVGTRGGVVRLAPQPPDSAPVAD